jgi:hypothetical protein
VVANHSAAWDAIWHDSQAKSNSKTSDAAVAAAYCSNLASMVIVAFKTREMGQPDFALPAAVANASAVAVGTFAVTSR